jgi:hypothetical protein
VIVSACWACLDRPSAEAPSVSGYSFS